jgi:hypothetical protein
MATALQWREQRNEREEENEKKEKKKKKRRAKIEEEARKTKTFRLCRHITALMVHLRNKHVFFVFKQSRGQIPHGRIRNV